MGRAEDRHDLICAALSGVMSGPYMDQSVEGVRKCAEIAVRAADAVLAIIDTEAARLPPLDTDDG